MIIMMIMIIVFIMRIIIQAYLAWGEFPVITTVSTTALPIDQLPWPSFTICNQVLNDDDGEYDDDDDNIDETCETAVLTFELF